MTKQSVFCLQYTEASACSNILSFTVLQLNTIYGWSVGSYISCIIYLFDIYVIAIFFVSIEDVIAMYVDACRCSPIGDTSVCCAHNAILVYRFVIEAIRIECSSVISSNAVTVCHCPVVVAWISTITYYAVLVFSVTGKELHCPGLTMLIVVFLVRER